MYKLIKHNQITFLDAITKNQKSISSKDIYSKNDAIKSSLNSSYEMKNSTALSNSSSKTNKMKLESYEDSISSQNYYKPNVGNRRINLPDKGITN